MTSKFCPVPFGHVMIATNGDYQVCCLHPTPSDQKVNIGQHAYETWRDSNYLKQVQKNFRENRPDPGCVHCWKQENLGNRSLRQRLLEEYTMLGVHTADDLVTYPVNVEINLGNLCNLKCLMCNETASSALLAENIRLGINQYQQKDFHWSSQAFENLQQLLSRGPKIINIRGGEPFYNKDLLTLIQNLPQDMCETSLLHITTNATVWNENWAQALQKFRLVRVMISLDGVGDTYEYLRYPGDWQQVEQNVLDMQAITNMKLLVHCVAQNLNVTRLGQMADWCQQHNLYLEFDQLIDPPWLSFLNLPRVNKLRAIEALAQDLKQTRPAQVASFMQGCLDQLTHATQQEDNVKLWQQFQTQVGLRDRLRNTDYHRLLQI
jgi:molybdenum cofactor biosynthesis enzyme MoaA